MPRETEGSFRYQPSTQLSSEFCIDFKHKLADSAYVVIINPFGLATFTALKRSLFRSPMDETLWRGILHERILVQRPEVTSEEVRIGQSTMRVRYSEWNLIQDCLVSSFGNLRNDNGVESDGWKSLPSESMVRRMIAEDLEPWFTWPAQELSPLEGRWLDMNPV